MEVNAALVEAVTRELLKRIQAGNLDAPAKKPLLIVGKPDLSAAALQALEDEYAISYYEQGADVPEGADVLVSGLSKHAIAHLASNAASCSAAPGVAPEKPAVQPSSGCSNKPGVPQGEAVFQPKRGKRVISEGDLIRACPIAGGLGQSIEIGVTDLLTPLAVDYAAKMHVEVRRV
jgi:hypothetical protein